MAPACSHRKGGGIETSNPVGGFMPVITTEWPVAPETAASVVGRMEVVAANGPCIIVDRAVDVEALLRLIRGLKTLR